MVPTGLSIPDRSSWRDVVARLESRADLSLEDVANLANACWWLGDVTSYLRRGEELHDRFVEKGRPLDAAEMALRLAVTWAVRGDVPLALGWQSRAERLLDGLPRGPVHGLAVYTRAASELELDADPSRVLAAAAELDMMARQHHDKELDCFARTVHGMASVLEGDVAGFRDLDEAMSVIVAGHVDPLWAGDIYCAVIHLCEGVRDLARMRAWTDSLSTWAAPLSSTFLFAGVTRVHQLQLLRAEGDWDTVERELGEWSEHLVGGHGWLAGVGFYELGEVHRLRDRPARARACFDRARSLGIEPQPGEALLLHARGDTTQALDGLRVALAGAPPLERAPMLGATTEIALAAGDTVWAESAARDLADVAARYGTPGLLADAAVARAACDVAAGAAVAAIPQLEAAARTYREQRHQHALARVHESMATAHRAVGATGRAAADEATARAIYQRLGAAADLARLTPRELPAGLTRREVEVLAQVSGGLTNREVAEMLTISQKTVGRHLESIFTKTGVTSRTAAAAWARTHGLL